MTTATENRAPEDGTLKGDARRREGLGHMHANEAIREHGDVHVGLTRRRRVLIDDEVARVLDTARAWS